MGQGAPAARPFAPSPSHGSRCGAGAADTATDRARAAGTTGVAGAGPHAATPPATVQSAHHTRALGALPVVTITAPADDEERRPSSERRRPRSWRCCEA